MYKNTRFVLLVTILLMGSLFISNPTSTSAVGELSDDVIAGNNYWYSITSFPSLQDLIDLGEDDGNVTLTATGGLQGAEIYAKVISVQDEVLSYWDGSHITSSFQPTVDIAAGLITGSPIELTANDSETTLTTNLPAGIGLPIPVIFGMSTQFNISNSPMGLLPVPLILNNDYDLHHTVAKQLEQLGGGGIVTVTNDASQFKVELDSLRLGNETTDPLADGLISWRKSDGALQEINVLLTDGPDTLADIDIDLDRVEYVGLELEVGDKYSISVDEASMSPATYRFNPQDDPINALVDVKEGMEGAVDTKLFEFEVMEIDDLYYRVEGSLWNGSELVPVPDPNDPNNIDVWMVGFGKLFPPVPLPGAAFGNLGNQAQRLGSLPGPIVTKDWKIYAAWDKTMGYVFETGVIAFLEILEEIDVGFADDVDLFSSITDDPQIVGSYTGSETALGGFDTSLDLNWDAGIWANDSWAYWSNQSYWLPDGTFVPMPPVWEEGWKVVEIDTTGTLNLDVLYDEWGVLDEFSISGHIKFDIKETNSTHVIQDWGVELSNIVFSLKSEFTPVTPRTSETTDTSDTTTDTTDTSDSDTSEDSPGFDLPGFEIYLSIISFIGLVFYSKRR
ncbi:MAG: hypothetical protein ACXAD7_15470 [Candidatus Kariarchaeaceae archaeon]|jgi:hypothetical protein